MPASQEHEAAHRRLIAQVHIGPGVAGGAAKAEPDQDVANFGKRREHECPYEIGQAQKCRDLTDKKDGRPYPCKRFGRCHQRCDWEMVQHEMRSFR